MFRNQNGTQQLVVQFLSDVNALIELLHPLLFEVKTHHRIPGGQKPGQRKAHVAQPDDGNICIHGCVFETQISGIF